ncbi:MAG: hypothetical protein ACYDH8_09880 [Syntrophales bacterium]
MIAPTALRACPFPAKSGATAEIWGACSCASLCRSVSAAFRLRRAAAKVGMYPLWVSNRPLRLRRTRPSGSVKSTST